MEEQVKTNATEDKNIHKKISKAKKCGLDGVEVYYSGFSQEQITTLEKFCKEHNLYMSAGTDCHGERKPNIKLGIGLGNMNVSEEVIKSWL